MHKNNQMYPELVRKYGVEALDLADKTWPLLIPDKMRLVAILMAKATAEMPSITVALDVTESKRYETYLNQLLNGKWSSIRLYFLSEHVSDYCRHRHEP